MGIPGIRYATQEVEVAVNGHLTATTTSEELRWAEASNSQAWTSRNFGKGCCRGMSRKLSWVCCGYSVKVCR